MFSRPVFLWLQGTRMLIFLSRYPIIHAICQAVTSRFPELVLVWNPRGLEASLSIRLWSWLRIGLFLVYLCFFTYDRCLDLVVRGSRFRLRVAGMWGIVKVRCRSAVWGPGGRELMVLPKPSTGRGCQLIVPGS